MDNFYLPNLIDPSVLNIFCDGSIKTFGNVTVGSAGAMGFCGYENVCWNFKDIPAATNNITELMAIYSALECANSHKHMYWTINIFSDSKICVYSLLQWYKSWFINMTDHGTLYSTTGEPVKNQEYIKQIIDYVVDNGIIVNLYHQKGHVSLQNNTSLENARYVFMVSNNLEITDDQLKYISKYNDLIDKKTKMRLELINPEKYAIRPEMALIPIISDMDLLLYANCMGTGSYLNYSKDIEMETF